MKRQITSLVLFLSTLIMAITGVVMFAMPGGGPGGPGGAQFLGLDKGQHKALHVVFMVPLVIAALLHAAWNIRPLLSYCKTRSAARKRQALGLAMAVTIVAVCVGGTLTNAQPFTTFVDLGHKLSHPDGMPRGAPGMPAMAGGSAAPAGESARTAGVPAASAQTARVPMPGADGDDG